jgi:thiopurine S-methyltransferase
MDAEFWVQRWKEGRTGFHEGRPNAFLERHAEQLGQGRRILVPLCGKAEDLAFLARAPRGHEVVGVEVVTAAVDAFFREHEAELGPVTERRTAHGRVCSAGRVTIHEADYFACGPTEIGRVDGFYDRAALVALPQEKRAAYVKHTRSLMTAGSVGLIVTFEYDQGRIDGPPFPVTEAEVRTLYAGATVQQIDQGAADMARFRDAGVSVMERCFAITL